MASGQYVVKPGAVSAAGSCFGEAWHSDFGNANLANVTCRADAPFHFTMGVGLPESGPESYGFEGQYQIQAYEDAGYDLGIFAGTSYDTGFDELAESLLLLPVTVQPIPDRLNLHVNLGAVHSHQMHDTEAFWGVAAELKVVGPLSAVTETFATGGDDPSVQAGLRVSLLEGRLTLDASYMEEAGPGDVSGWAAGAAFQIVTF